MNKNTRSPPNADHRSPPSTHKGYTLSTYGIPLRNLEWFSSVWSIPPVHFVEREDHHPAPFPEELVRRLILIYSQKGDLVLDPFAGSGTTNYVALKLGRETIGYDIEEKFIEAAKERCAGQGTFYAKSSENMSELEDSSVDLCVTSPPYRLARRYSDKAENIGNIADPFPALKNVFSEVHRVLKQWRYFCLNVSGVTERGYVDPFPFEVLRLCTGMGWRLRTTIIWDKGIRLTEFGLKYRQVSESHEYIWVLRKVRGDAE